MTTGASYKNYIETLKKEIAQARIKAHLAVNKELIHLYWKIGCQILQMQGKEGWDAKIIDQISKNLSRFCEHFYLSQIKVETK